MALRSLIVDDNARFLSAARTLLECDGIAVVGVASSCAEAIQLAAALQPDVALVDIDLGDESGFDVARRLAGAKLSRVVLISAYPEADFAELIAASPAVGFLAKSDVSAMRLREVLRRAADGGNGVG
jgi:two-component system, NarL family, nitrate/nitrite response regulator NarL